MQPEQLARVDEHSVVVDAPPEAVWDAAWTTFQRSFSGKAATTVARVLGCEPIEPVAGFRVVTEERPRLLVVAGRHRFSRYAIVLRVAAVEGGSRCTLESRADFPGPHGRLYRLAVVGSGGHALAVRRLLRSIKDAAERPATATA